MKKIILTFMIMGAMVFITSGVSLGQGSDYSIKTMTPEVKQSLEKRRERFSELQDLKKQGIIGESNTGYVEVLKTGMGAESIVTQENRDRKIIYTEIVKQNNLDEALSIVEKVFANVQREKALPGEKVQDENGNWITKE